MHSLENRSPAHLEQWLKQTLDAQRPFVMYRSPGDERLVCLTEPAFNSHNTSTEFVFAPFALGKPILKIISPEGFYVDWTSLTEAPTKLVQNHSEQENAKKDYEEGVRQIQAAIQNSEVTKVVLSRMMQLPVERDPWSVFVRLLFKYANACCYWWYHPESGHWLGATPEVLLQVVDNEVQVMSLAGTLPADAANKASWSEKELEEQAVVTNYIEEILQSFGGPVSKEGPVTLQAGNLLHLRTMLKTKLDGGLENLLQELHPTPAVCGFPTHKAARLIADLEVHDREYYTGYFGIRSLDPNIPTQLYVNLRCMKWTASEVSVFVGGGITAGSDVQREWQETIDKSRTLLDVLDITLV